MRHSGLFRIFTTFWLLGVLLLSSNSLTAQVNIEEGKTLFGQYCSACHKPDVKAIGPALKGVNEKYANDREFLYKWVQNAPGLAASGDERAIELSQQEVSAMSAFPFLTEANIDDILGYVDDFNINVPEPPKKTEDAVLDPGIYYALLGLVGLLAVIALLLVVITATLVTAVQSKEGREPFTLASIMGRTKAILSNKYVATALATFILLGGTSFAIDWGQGIGLYQGYMPDQPIKFSHKLHAGENQIDCQYCHTGVTKSKNAWIPSANVCMNCHKYINKGPNYGETEIAKIYDAIGWDPTTQSYTGDTKPIEWIRIHNNPDHAYFNHAQHVVVGNQECTTCHGPVEEMEVVYQYSNLGMGWCISCHREEKVKVLGHDNKEGLTVEDMGGLDCARCHY